jgi:hypothetical protein
MRSLVSFIAIAACAIDCGLSNAQESGPAQAPSPSPSSISPDKQWEYKCVEYGAGDCLPRIVKAGTTQRVVDLNDVPDGARGMGAEIRWSPDSKRFAFNYSTPLTHHSYDTVAFYQLRDDKWEALRSLADGLADEAYPRHCDQYQGIWQLRNWSDPNTAILYAACSGTIKSAFLFTLKFSDAGTWKIVGTHVVPVKGTGGLNKAEQEELKRIRKEQGEETSTIGDHIYHRQP